MLHTTTLLLALSLGADDAPSIEFAPSELTAKPGRMLKVAVRTNGKTVRWVALSEDCDIIPFPDGKSAIFSAPTEGVYRILAYTALADQPSEPAICTITVGKAPPKPPGPGPKPPVPPSDPLVRKLQTAFDKDTEDLAKKQQWLSAITGFYAAMSAHVTKKKDDGEFAVITIGDLLSDYTNAIPAVLPKDVLKELRAVLGEEVFALTGDDADKKLNSELRQAISDLFLKLSKALEQVK